MSEKIIDEPTGVETTGHSWDGIAELNNPLPRWWLYIMYATIVFAIVYMILYPSVPLINQATPGLLGYSSRADVEGELTRVAATRAELDQQIASLSFQEIAANPTLSDYARRSGASAFKMACVQCHGSGAAGSQQYGYPNLNDDDWLWGGSIEDIFTTITHGVRSEDDADARSSLMPAFGAMGMLNRNQISDVAHYVLSLSGSDEAGDAEAEARGAEVYTAQCAVCHGVNGEGNQSVGAPRLSDPIWLYGGTYEDIVRQVSNPHMGVMPAWSVRFDDATRKELAIFVHSLGGGQ
ncbi:cytochrome-c oxidase, cbb3-type subunit III [Acuticoccus mangrovi]|uniref:Cbb3-type cytochrome c oxidase subunit n=1 Tax=Acuticoccus mangrovi TaxID=2796142 RepID=A0A934ISP1_9HYPH|nr:cytochrome-c oxidase, cbb3-type subunit III [Acuticoccus mangrovi]MBJ3777487.1 cytochrome-c oxidase, cbb3-type subunit III [Acuticoccus mangrovi]